MEYSIELAESHGAQTAVVVARVAPQEIAAFMGQVFGEVMDAVGASSIIGPPFCRVLDIGPEMLMEVGFAVMAPIQPTGRVVPSSLPEGQVARTMHTGPYDGVAAAYQAIEAWIAERGMQRTGAPWETYLDGPEVEMPRTVVSWPCR